MGVKIEIIYVFPVTGEPHHAQLALRFLESYHRFDPGIAHDTVVVANGGEPDESFWLFKTMPNMRIFKHNDSGYDIGAYQAYVPTSTADMIVFLGGSSYCRRPGWLARMAGMFEKLGPGNLYGTSGNCGQGTIMPHIRTTGFACAPDLLKRYPVKVTRPEQRYPFEHGPQNFTQWTRSQGRRAYVVDAEGYWEWPHWNAGPNGYHRNYQSALLVGDRLTTSPFFPYP